MEPVTKNEKTEICKQQKSSPDKSSYSEKETSKNESKNKSIHQKIIEIYKNEKLHQNNKNITASHVLKKLVSKEKLNNLLITLYPKNQGYSLMLKTNSGTDSQVIHLPYEEEELLEYIDNEQLPPILVDLLERSKESMFYDGCVIVEVCDYRNNEKKYSHYTLLKPTNQSIISDFHQIISNYPKWSQDDKHALESSLILATSDPLCLDPSPSVTYLLNKLNYQRNILSRPPLKRHMKSLSQITLNKKSKLEQSKSSLCFRLYDYLKNRQKKPSSLFNPLKININPQACTFPYLEVPTEINVHKMACPIPPSNPTPENDVIAVEEYLMEVQDKNCGKVSFTNITILQNSIDEQYMGKLYIGRDGQDSGTSCIFKLGDQASVQKYIDQFTEIFTEKGRRSVKITHLVPGHAPSISFTQGARENMAEKFKLPNLTAALSSPSKDVREHDTCSLKEEDTFSIKHEAPSSPESSPIDVMTTSTDSPPLSLSTKSENVERAEESSTLITCPQSKPEDPSLTTTSQLHPLSLSPSLSLGTTGLNLSTNYSLHNLVPLNDLSSLAPSGLLGPSTAVIVSSGTMSPAMLSSPLSLATPNLAAHLMAASSQTTVSLLGTQFPLLPSLVRPTPKPSSHPRTSKE